MNYGQLLTFLFPETLVVLAAFGALLMDVTTMRGESIAARMRWAAWTAVMGCLAAGLAVYLVPSATPPGYLGGMLEVNALTQMVKIGLLLLAAGTALISMSSQFTRHAGEYYVMLLLATVGAMFMVSSGNVLLIFIALELLSLSLYVMTAFNKADPRSAEAALKYFLFGGISAAFLLFGLSLFYGISGELTLAKMAPKLAAAQGDPLLMLGLLMTFTGLGFKVAAVPFHLWAPDTYQGAPLPSAAFIASASKVASFFVLARLMLAGFAGEAGAEATSGFNPVWVPVLAVGAALSVVIGNLAAIVQGSVRRLLAYSAVAHAGYMLIGVLADRKADGLASLLYYVMTYAVTAVGAFAVVGRVQAQSGGGDPISAFAGLSRRSPLLAVCLMLFLLSMAGIPPLAGFFGKFYIFKAALFELKPTNHPSLFWLVVLAILMSAVSLYYYLQVLKQVFVMEPRENDSAVSADAATRWVVGLAGAAVVVLGCWPDLLVGRLTAAIQAAGF